MSIRIHIPTPMRQHTDNQAVVESAGSTVKGLLDSLGQQHPAIAGRIFENGQVRRFINIYLNDEDIRYLDNLNTAVKDEVGVVDQLDDVGAVDIGHHRLDVDGRIDGPELARGGLDLGQVLGHVVLVE